MKRSVLNEVMIAIGAVFIIVFGLFFAVLLSRTTDEDSLIVQTTGAEQPITVTTTDNAVAVVSQIPPLETSPITNTALSSPTQPLTSSPTPTATFTMTATATLTMTHTMTPSLTPTATATLSPSPTPTATQTPTATATITQTASPTFTATATATMTATIQVNAVANGNIINLPTQTATATTTLTATATQTITPSSIPTATATPTATMTPSPTATATLSPSPTPTATQTPTATATATSIYAITGIIPTPPPSPTISPLDSPTRTPTTCELPTGWTTYTVLPGNTLFAIALATDSTVDELRFANCIENIDNITAGDTIFIPRDILRPVATIQSVGIRQGLAPIGCTSPLTQITSPIVLQRVNGVITLFGTATRADFQYYKIEIRPDWAEIYNFYSDSQTPVANGILADVNTDIFGDGLHWIRLSVVDRTAAIQPDALCEVPVIFE